MGKTEETFVSPLAPLTEKWQTVYKILQFVDNPTVALSLEEISDMLLDLGCAFSNVQEKGNLNPDVFEHPKDISDSLGNCLMIHKPLKRWESRQIALLGQSISNMAHSFARNYRKAQQIYAGYDENLYLDDWDEVASADNLAARRHIAKLQRENYQLEKQNTKLFARLARNKASAKRLKIKRPGFHDQDDSSQHRTLEKSDEKNQPQRQTNCLRFE